MKKQRKKPDPLNAVIDSPDSLDQIQTIVGKNGVDFLREFQHHINHKVSPEAVFSWLIDLQRHKQAITLDNLGRVRLARTKIALKNSAMRPMDMRDRKQRNHRRKVQQQPTHKDPTKLRQVGRAKKGGQYYGRPIRSSRPSAHAVGVSGIISVPIGGQPSRRRRKNRRR